MARRMTTRLLLLCALALPGAGFAQANLFDAGVTTMSAPVSADRFLIGDQSNQVGKCCVITYADLLAAIEADLGIAASAVTSGTFADARISASSVTQHQASLAITESQISDLGSYLTGITGESIGSLSDVTITTVADGELLTYSSGAGDWINETLAEAGISAVGHTHTESDITDLGSYLTSVDLTTDVTNSLPISSGGTGATTASGARTALGVDPAGTDNSTPVTLAGSYDYLTLSGQQITRGQVDLSTDVTGSLPSSSLSSFPWSIGVALSDETTDLTTGTAKITFRMPFAATLTAIRASVTTAPAGSTIEIDCNEGGVSVLSTVVSIDAGEKTSTTAATAAVISDSTLADDAEITCDIDQVGSSTAGTGAKLWLKGTRTI